MTVKIDNNVVTWVGDNTNVVTASSNDPWFVPVNARIVGHSLGFGVGATGVVTVELLVNSSLVASISTTDGVYSGVVALSLSLAPGDKVEANIVAATAGHQNITYSVYVAG